MFEIIISNNQKIALALLSGVYNYQHNSFDTTVEYNYVWNVVRISTTCTAFTVYACVRVRADGSCRGHGGRVGPSLLLWLPWILYFLAPRGQFSFQ